MKIKLEEKYIGAALVQIAEDRHFTAINSLKRKSKPIKNAYTINDNRALFCKYGENPNTQGEYQFTFNREHIEAIQDAIARFEATYLALCCINAEEICCLSGTEFLQLMDNREQSATDVENLLVILITAEDGKSFRAYVNAAGRRGIIAGKPLTISRRSFPSKIFT